MSTETKQNPDQQPVQEIADVLPEFETVTADEVIDEDPELIQGVLRTGQKLLAIGASKTFKSHLAVDMALSLTQAGTEWLGNQVTSSGPVVYVNPEISSKSMRKRVQYMAIGSGKTQQMENLQLVNLRGYRLTISQVVSSLILRHRQRVAKGLPPVRAYIMDSIYYLMAGTDENSSSEVIDKILVELDRLIEQTGAAVIVILHKNKSGSGSRFDSASGTGAWGRWADGTVTLTAVPSSDDQRYFKAEYDLRDLSPHPDTYFSCSIPHITLIDQADIPKKETKKSERVHNPGKSSDTFDWWKEDIMTPNEVMKLLSPSNCITESDIQINGDEGTPTEEGVKKLISLIEAVTLRDALTTYIDTVIGSIQEWSSEHTDVRVIYGPGDAYTELDNTGNSKAFFPRELDKAIEAGDDGRYTLQEVRDRFTFLRNHTNNHGRRVSINAKLYHENPDRHS